jgi:Raf kinase inhibitor-like YbhB/YbcL family protein
MKFLIFSLSLIVGGTSFAADLTVTSDTIKKGGTVPSDQVFNGFGCSGPNISPDLKWSGAPKETKAFAVTMYDPDAPTGSGWWHWTVINIPSTATGLDLGASMKKTLPPGSVEARTDFGKTGYGGPCPPQGDKPHRYIFKVYALKDVLPLDKDAPGAQVGFYANSMKLAEGKLEAKYGRK